MTRAYRELPTAVWILAAGTLVNRAGAMLLPFLTIYLCVEMGRSVAFATSTMAAYGAGSLTAALLGGYLADVIGRKRVMLLSMIGGAIFISIWSVVQHPVAIVAIAAVTALFMEMYRPASAALIADLVPSEQRPHAFGLIHVAVNLGFTVAPLVGGMLAERSFLLVFLGDAVTALAFAAIIWRFVVEPATESSPGPSRAGLPFGTALRAIARDRSFMTFCGASFLIAMIYVQASTTLPLFLTQAGYTPSQFGRLIAVNGLLIVLFQLPLTALVSRLDRNVALAISAVLVGTGFALHGAGTSVFAIILAIVVWTGGEMAIAPLAGSLVADLAPTELRARYLGVFTFSYTAAMLLGPLIGGAVLIRWGAEPLWFGCLGAGVVCAALFLRARRESPSGGRVPARQVTRRHEAGSAATRRQTPTRPSSPQALDTY